VLRAELFALHRVLIDLERRAGNAPETHQVDVDAQYVVAGYAKTTKQMRGEANGALWAQVLRLRDALRSRGHLINVGKVTAHITDEQQSERKHTRQQLTGNMIADELAGRAAEEARTPFVGRRTVQWCDATATRVLKRLVAIAQHVAEHFPMVQDGVAEAPSARPRVRQRPWRPTRGMTSSAQAKACDARDATRRQA
jgi:hypothetical protein